MKLKINQETTFETEIKPLAAEIAKICKKAKLPFLISFGVKSEETQVLQYHTCAEWEGTVKEVGAELIMASALLSVEIAEQNKAILWALWPRISRKLLARKGGV